MARTILYFPRQVRGLEFAQRALNAPRYDPDPDTSYVDRLARYIPGEAMAAFEGAALVKSSSRAVLIIILVAVVLGNLLYLWIQSRKDVAKSTSTSKARVLPHFYVLSSVAFLIWACVLDHQTAALFHLSEQSSRILVVLAAYLLPTLDNVCALLAI